MVLFAKDTNKTSVMNVDMMNAPNDTGKKRSYGSAFFEMIGADDAEMIDTEAANMVDRQKYHRHTKPLSASITLPVDSATHQSCAPASLHRDTSMPSIQTESTSSSAPLPTTSMPAAPPTSTMLEDVKVISSPQDFFTSLLKARGYPGTTHCSLKSGYHNTPTVR